MVAASADAPQKSPKSVNLRSIALPAEHDGWGFLLEPSPMGLLYVILITIG